MNPRRCCAAAALLVLLAAAVAGAVRSAAPPATDPVRAVASDLRCPACQGESVADSRSPIAAAMREVVAAQLAQGRRPAEIRAYFLQRYGPEVLAVPAPRGPALLLWAVPALALLLGALAAARTLRARPAPATAPEAPAAAARSPIIASRVWRAGAGGLVTLVAAVAFAATRTGPAQPAEDAAADPAAAAVLLARDLEQRHQYGAAAEMYQQALRDRPDETVRVRLAFALLRAGRPAEAAPIARQVLEKIPDSPDALLVLGLAQRSTRSAEATATLRRFLTAAPDHPAAVEIRRLLAER